MRIELIKELTNGMDIFNQKGCLKTYSSEEQYVLVKTSTDLFLIVDGGEKIFPVEENEFEGVKETFKLEDLEGVSISYEDYSIKFGSTEFRYFEVGDDFLCGSEEIVFNIQDTISLEKELN